MALNSKEELVPSNLTWDSKLTAAPMAIAGQDEVRLNFELRISNFECRIDSDYLRRPQDTYL